MGRLRYRRDRRSTQKGTLYQKGKGLPGGWAWDASGTTTGGCGLRLKAAGWVVEGFVLYTVCERFELVDIRFFILGFLSNWMHESSYQSTYTSNSLLGSCCAKSRC